MTSKQTKYDDYSLESRNTKDWTKIVSKQVLVRNLLKWKWVSFEWNEHGGETTIHECFCTETHFDTEAKGETEMDNKLNSTVWLLILINFIEALISQQPSYENGLHIIGTFSELNY